MKNNQNDRQPLSDAQMEIMNIIWDADEVTVSQVWLKLQENRTVARNTVQTLITRMEEKKWLVHRNVGNQFLYKAAFEKTKSLPKILDDFLNNVFAGSTNNLIMTLFQNKNLDKKEIEELKQLIQDMEGKKND